MTIAQPAPKGRTGQSAVFADGIWLVVAVRLAFGVGNAAARLWFGHSLSPADSLEVIAAQEFRFSFRADQPPLFTWLLWASNAIFGPTQLSMQFVKYALMLASGVLLYMAGRVATGDSRAAVLGSIVPLLLFNVGFSIHDQSTHSIALILAIAGLIYGYALLARDGSVVAYGIVGLAMVAGVLSKHSFGILAVALQLACLVDPVLRRRVVSIRFAVMLAVVLICLLPFALWMLEHRGDATSRLAGTIALASEKPAWLVAVLGPLKLMLGLVILVGPILLVFAVLFAHARDWKGGWPRFVLGRGGAGISAVLVRAAWLGALMIGVGLVAAGGEKVPSRHLLILALPAVAGLTWEAARMGVNTWAFKALLALVVVSQATLLATRVGTYALPGWPFCESCHHLRPVEALAATLRQRGYAAATIVVNEPVTGANLMPSLPEARIVLMTLPRQTAPSRVSLAQGKTCLLLLDRPGRRLGVHHSFGRDAGNVPAVARSSAERIVLPRRADGRTAYTWSLAVLSPDHALCAIGPAE